MKGEYNIVLAETRQSIDNLFRVVEVDDSFPEYVDGLKASMSACLMNFYPLCQGKAYKQEKWNDLRSIYDQFVEKADVAWHTYVTSRDSKWAFKSKVRFDGHEMKVFLHLPKENVERYLQELKDAIETLQSKDPKKPDEAEVVGKTSSYFHKAYLYIKNSDNQKRLAKFISAGRLKDICRLSQQYEQLCNIFLSQSQYVAQPKIPAKYSVFMQNYLRDFRRMNRAKLKGETAPHKIILLLAILDLVEQKGGKLIPTNRLYELIPFGCGLDKYFMEEWTKHVHSTTFKPSIENPLIHMASEPFYSLKRKEDAPDEVPHSLSSIKKAYVGIHLEENLITLMLEPATRDRLRSALIDII